jgi:hypothetical protein
LYYARASAFFGHAGTEALCFIVAALEDHRSVGQVPRIEIRGWRNKVGLRRLTGWAKLQQFGKGHQYPLRGGKRQLSTSVDKFDTEK